MMKLFAPKILSEDKRTVLTPESSLKLIKAGIAVSAEPGVGNSLFTDEAYARQGVTLLSRQEGLAKSDMVIFLDPPGDEDLALISKNAKITGLLRPFESRPLLEKMARAGVTSFSMEMIPRSTIAQKMDVLSSQANLAGYVAVILAAERLNKIFPMMTTPAGTISPSRVFVIGAGVAGLQAIATAKRLGARVEAFDTRPAVEEQVRSLGAKFVKVDLGETGQTSQGYAKELTEEQLQKQRDAMAKQCALSDVVITTAQLFGRPAPRIVTADMIKGMAPGSVIVDLAVETGGNVEGAELNKEVTKHGVHIIGLGGLPGRVAVHASQMLAANFTNFILHFWDAKNHIFKMDTADEIIRGTLMTHEGRIVHPSFSAENSVKNQSKPKENKG